MDGALTKHVTDWAQGTAAASAIDAGQLEAWTTGSWNVQAGGLLEAAWYAASDHFILDDLPARCIPPGYQIIPGFDWGESSPSALLTRCSREC